MARQSAAAADCVWCSRPDPYRPRFLKNGLTHQDAADLAFLIGSVENYLLATGSPGWPPERWERSIVSMLTKTVLGTPGTQQALPHNDGP